MGFHVVPTETFSKAPAGQYQAVCCEFIDMGWSEKVYKNQQTGEDEPRTIHEGQYIFQLNKVDDETGKRFEIRSKPFNLILSEKASLRAFLLQWRGHDLTPEELRPPGVDLEMAGRNALIQVIHNQSGDKTYANIGSIMPLMDGMTPIEPLNYESKQAAVTAKRAAAAANPQTNGFSGPAQPAPQVQPQVQNQTVANLAQSPQAPAQMPQPQGEVDTSDIPF